MTTPTNDSLNRCVISRSITRISSRDMEEQEIHRAGGASSSLHRGQDNRHTTYPIQQIENVFMKNPHLDEVIIATKEALKNPCCDKSIGWVAKEDSTVRRYNYNALIPLNLIETQSRIANGMPIQKEGYLKLASCAMDELLQLGMTNAPLWTENNEGGGETLNFDEYERVFPSCLGPKKLGFVPEATRASDVVMMSAPALVEALLDVNQWREMFVGILGSCTTRQVISTGTGDSRDGVLQLMEAEIQLLSHEVPARVMRFIRFTKCHEDGVWVVVDLSVDAQIEGHLTRRQPSGCIIHDLSNGFSKVTWIEHLEYDLRSIPKHYHRLISSGVGFGAQRWINALSRHCECMRATMSNTLYPNLFISVRRNLKGLAQRMTRIFCDAVCLTDGQHRDTVVKEPATPRIMARQLTADGEQLGLAMSATYSVVVPTEHGHLFDQLLRNDLRVMWDVICHAIARRAMIRIPFSPHEDDRNCISVLKSNEEENPMIMVLQESASDMTGSRIVYATVDSPTINAVVSTGEISDLAILPSGVSIVPNIGDCGSLVTVMLQLLLPNETILDVTMETINNVNYLVSRTILGIRGTVQRVEL